MSGAIRSEMMRAKGQEKNDRKRNSDRPKQDRTHLHLHNEKMIGFNDA
jgi:hypothetical protein